MQVDPIKPTFKSPGSKLLRLEHEKLLSNFAFNFNLRRYNEVLIGGGADGATLLYDASKNGRLDEVEILLGGGAEVNTECQDASRTDGIAVTPLYIASENGHAEVGLCRLTLSNLRRKQLALSD